MSVVVYSFGEHAVTSSAGEHGRIEPAGTQVVADGTPLWFSLVPDEGWLVDAVEVDGVPVQRGGSSFSIPAAFRDMDVHVAFRAAKPPDPALPFAAVAVEVAPGEDGAVHGAVSPGSLSSVYGASHVFYVYPDEGWDLERVEADGAAVPFEPVAAALRLRTAARPAAYSFELENVTRDTHVEVSFRRLSAGERPAAGPAEALSVRATASAGGSIWPDGAVEAPPGGSVSFSLLADEGFRLAALSVDGADASADVLVSADARAGLYVLEGIRADAEVHADFAAESPSVWPPAPAATDDLAAVPAPADALARTGDGAAGMRALFACLAFAALAAALCAARAACDRKDR